MQRSFRKRVFVQGFIFIAILLFTAGLEYQTSQAGQPQSPHLGFTMTPKSPKPTPAKDNDDPQLPATGGASLPERSDAGASFPALSVLLRGLGPQKPAESAASREVGVVMDESAIQEISIPALGLNAPVLEARYEKSTWDISMLQKEIAWLERTSLPGERGNTVLAGHLTLPQLGKGPLFYIASLKSGDKITLQTMRYVYTYKVASYVTVDRMDTSLLKQAANRLTLVTCMGWNERKQIYESRQAVIADLVSVYPVNSGLP